MRNPLITVHRARAKLGEIARESVLQNCYSKNRESALAFSDASILLTRIVSVSGTRGLAAFRSVSSSGGNTVPLTSTG